ncbi:extracellular solute-binding protein [Paenibacillus qinlingensis]|uniref:extracellular solute-binding protein n=1 Tax=Paenibacillus qinlingensis TaxID=1837343 RepID=UPI0015631F87|nr:extracellular solute-binding protein [Paenibacillus qinlingensis]NQX64234.1 extracellular solute-binding protein [Paenibacillus qinlingensis]
MKIRKKLGVTLLSVSMLGSLTIACSNTDSTGTNETSPAKVSAIPSASVAPSTGPKYPASLTYWTVMNTDAAVSIKNYSEMGLYKQLEKVTGTKVEFQHPPAGEAQVKDQFNLMMATGKLPDVIYNQWSVNFPDKAIKDGRILRLNELIEKNAPNLSKYLKDNPNIRKSITSDDGNIYAFPSIGSDPQVFVYHGLMIRKDWLDKLNLQPPKTIEEWEKVLIAFRDGDPNGNGKKDEIPFFYRQTDMESSYPFLGAYGLTTGFYQEGGVVKYGPAQPKYKDFLTLMNNWYKAGLIDKDYLTSDAKIRDGKMLDNQLGSMAGWVGSSLGAFMQLKRDKEPNFKLIGVPFPTIAGGGKPVSTVGVAIDGRGAAISATAKNPEQIAAWLDYGYSKEGALMYNFGVEGQSYSLVSGKPQYTDTILKNPNKLSVSQALSIYSLETSGGPFITDPEADKQWHNDKEQADAMATWIDADHSKQLPGSLLNADEQAKFTTIMTDLNTYKNEMNNKFIMGSEPLSKFDEYIQTLNKLKIQEAIKLNQDAYDRFLKK